MSFLLGFQYWTTLPESREIWMRVGSDYSLHAGWLSPQPLLWAPLPLVGCHCTRPVNPLATLLGWLVSVSPYPQSILCATLPWEAALYAPHNPDSIALWLWLGLESERCGKTMKLGEERDLGVDSPCCLSAPTQFWQGQCSSMTTAVDRKPSSIALVLAGSW